MNKTLLGFAALLVILVFAATTIFYFTGPTTKTVEDRSWRGRHCVEYGPAEYRKSMLSNCISWAPAGYVSESNTVRTNAWERVSGAVTGEGDLDGSD
jgi:hypothetical protein